METHLDKGSAIVQGSENWHQIRRKHIGASDAPIVMEVSPWRTPFQLWEEKTGISSGQEDNSAMRYGRENEEKARVAYQVLTGHLVEPEVIFHPSIPYLMASLDGLSEDRTVAVEIKNANADDHALAKEGKVPDKYYPQLQQQLECAGLYHMHYFSYHKDEGIVINVKSDDKYIQKMLKKLEEFWKKVQAFEAPELIDRDLRERGDAWVAKATELAGYKAMKKHFDDLEKSCTKELIELSEGQSSRGGIYRFKKSTRSGSVQYNMIPELATIDLEKYRKAPIESWRLCEEKM